MYASLAASDTPVRASWRRCNSRPTGAAAPPWRASCRTVEHRHTVEVRVLAGEDGRTARCADQIRREQTRQQCAVERQDVAVWCVVDARPVGADRVASE